MEQLAQVLAAALDEKGWCVVDDALPGPLVSALADECGREAAESFRPAGTGRRHDYQRDARVRSDAIRWIDPSLAAGAQYLAAMETLRVELNSRLFLGLFDYECHYARYAPGAFYRKHVDAFVGDRNRVLSTVLYLNADWREDEGGELLLYTGEGSEAGKAVLPQYNRLVLFLSEGFVGSPGTELEFAL